jgi:hypothetical protein
MYTLMHHVMKMVSTYLQIQHHVSWYQSLSNVLSLWQWRFEHLLILAYQHFINKELVRQYKLVIVEKNTLMLVEVIDG